MGVYRESVRRPRLVFRDEKDREVCKVHTQRFFRRFARYHLEFLQQLADRCKEERPWGVMPTHVGDIYENSEDRQVALLLTMVLKWDTDRTEGQMRELRELAGAHPWEWFASGAFRAMAHGDLQEMTIDKNHYAQRWKLASLLDRIWSLCFDGGRNLSLEDVFLLHPFVPWMLEATDGYGWGDVRYKASMLELVFRTTDGLGQGLWTSRRAWGDHVWLPSCEGMRQFVALWLPECPKRDVKSSVFRFDEVNEVFGLKGDYDLFYAYLGWEAMSRRNHGKCAHYATVYQYRYDRCLISTREVWFGKRGVIPEIEF